MEKYHPCRLIQDFVFLSPTRGCNRCISLHVFNKNCYQTPDDERQTSYDHKSSH